jgi:hypothetical protein
MQYALPSDEERLAMLTGTGMYGGGTSQSMPTGNSGGGYYSQYQDPPKRNYGNWQDAMTIAEMRTIGDDILDEEGNPTGKKVYGDWRTMPVPKQKPWSPKGTDEPRYAGSGGGISGIPGGGRGLSSDEDRYAMLTGRGPTSEYDSSNYGPSSDEDRYALLTGRGSTSGDDMAWSGGSRDFDESTGTYRPGYRGTSEDDSSNYSNNYGLSSDRDRYAMLTGSGGEESSGSSGYAPSNYSLSGLSSGLSSDKDRYAMLTGTGSGSSDSRYSPSLSRLDFLAQERVKDQADGIYSTDGYAEFSPTDRKYMDSRMRYYSGY